MKTFDEKVEIESFKLAVLEELAEKTNHYTHDQLSQIVGWKPKRVKRFFTGRKFKIEEAIVFAFRLHLWLDLTVKNNIDHRFDSCDNES